VCAHVGLGVGVGWIPRKGGAGRSGRSRGAGVLSAGESGALRWRPAVRRLEGQITDHFARKRARDKEERERGAAAFRRGEKGEAAYAPSDIDAPCSEDDV
jgi:hypothetical protein